MRSRRRRPRGDHARRTRRRSCERTLERRVSVTEHGLAVRDEHHLDRKIEQRHERSAKVVPLIAAEVPHPGVGAQAQAGRTVSEDAVARDERRVRANPEHRLARAGDLDRLDALGHVAGSAVALHQLGPAPLVPGDRDADWHALLGTLEFVVRVVVAVGHERIDQDERARCGVRNTADVSRPIGRAVLLLGLLPVRVRRCPAPQPRGDLVQVHRWSVDDGHMEPVRWGILSTARINHAVLEPARVPERGGGVAAESRDEARARAYASEHDVERAYGSYEELLADPDIEAVYNSL